MSGLSSGASSFGQEELSLPARLLGVLYAPRRSFAAVAGRETALDWLLPAVAACLVGLAAHQLTVGISTDLSRPKVQTYLQQLDAVERQRYEQSMQVIRQQGWMMVPVQVFSSLVVTGALLLLFTRQLFNKEVTYRQVLVVKAYASLVLIPEWVAHTVVTLVTGDPEVYFGPAALLPAAASHGFAGRLLAGISLFDAWQVVIMALGLAAVAGARLRRALVGLLILWGLWIVGGAALEQSSAMARAARAPEATQAPVPSQVAPPQGALPDSGSAAPALPPSGVPAESGGTRAT